MRKEDLRAGDVVLFPPHKGDFIAWAIAFLSNGEVNHAALCYPDVAGKLCVAESILKDGLVLNPFADKISGEYPLRVARMKNQADMKPVLEAAGKYLAEKNTYPNFNLGLLGGLLLFNKFAPHTLKNKIVYQFIGLIAGKLMKLVQDRKHPGQHPMSCSQFVAQCFTDGGKGYDLKFNKLVVQFGTSSPMPCSVSTRAAGRNVETVSLASLLENEMQQQATVKTRACMAQPVSEFSFPDLSPEEEARLTEEFIRIASEKPHPDTCATRSCSVGEPEIPLSELSRPVKKIAFSLYALITGKQTDQLQVALDVLKTSTARNYFVSPQDIWANCPDSLEQVGLLSY